MALQENISAAQEAMQNFFAKVEALKQHLNSENAYAYHKISDMFSKFNEAVDASDDLSDALSAIEYPSVDVDETTYIITLPKFIFNNTEVTAEELSEDADLAAEILDTGSDILYLD